MTILIETLMKRYEDNRHQAVITPNGKYQIIIELLEAIRRKGIERVIIFTERDTLNDETFKRQLTDWKEIISDIYCTTPSLHRIKLKSDDRFKYQEYRKLFNERPVFIIDLTDKSLVNPKSETFKLFRKMQVRHQSLSLISPGYKNERILAQLLLNQQYPSFTNLLYTHMEMNKMPSHAIQQAIDREEFIRNIFTSSLDVQKIKYLKAPESLIENMKKTFYEVNPVIIEEE